MDDRSARQLASSTVVKPDLLAVALTAAVLALAQAGCGGGGDAPTPNPTCTVTSVTVAASPAAVGIGATSTLSATLDANGGCATGLTWSASPAGGTLTSSGATASFTSAAAGTYTITATSVADPSRSGSATVTVTQAPPVCTVTSVTVAASPAAIGIGATSTLSAILDATPACATGLTWSASPAGGTLTSSGANASFTSAAAGTYTVTATSVADPSRSGSATVTVTPAPPVCTVTSVTVAASSTAFVAGGTSSLSATLDATPACATGLTWSASPAGGTLTSSGATATFTSAAAGTYTIRATSVADTSRSGSATITVSPAPPACIVTGVTVSSTPTTFEAGGSSSLSATVTATAPCSRALTWTVSPAGGTLTSSGATASFTATTAGTYTITATSVENAARFGSAAVTVTPALPCTVSGLSLAAGPPAISTGGTSILKATLSASLACTRALDWSVSAGGTLTPSGATTTATTSFTATTQATYTVTVTSLDDATRTDTATITVGPAVACGQPNGSEITHPGGTVVTADETWVGDGVTHHLPGSVSITGTAAVTIQPCAIVTIGSIGSILVFDSGRLVSAGTGGGRFVEIGAASTGVRWGMISANGPNALVDLRFTNVREGGETVGLPMVLSGIGAGDDAPPAPVLRVQSVEISGSSGLGVSLAQNATFTADSVDLIIKDSGGYPLRANLVALGTLPSGSYTQNATKEGADEIVIHASTDLSTDMTIKNLGVPYRFEVPVVRVQPVAPASGPVTLTIQPGVVLKFPRRPQPGGTTTPGALFSFGTAGLTPNGTGVLHAVGTPAAPIVFTSGEVLPAAGDWQGLWLATAAGSQLDHVQIRYAGAPVTLSSGNCRPLASSDAAALLIGNLTDQYVPSATLLTNGTIADSAGHGISALWDAATASSGPDLTPTNTFLNLNGCRQTFNGLTGGGACPAGGGCTAP